MYTFLGSQENFSSGQTLQSELSNFSLNSLRYNSNSNVQNNMTFDAPPRIITVRKQYVLEEENRYASTFESYHEQTSFTSNNDYGVSNNDYDLNTISSYKKYCKSPTVYIAQFTRKQLFKSPNQLRYKKGLNKTRLNRSKPVSTSFKRKKLISEDFDDINYPNLNEPSSIKLGKSNRKPKYVYRQDSCHDSCRKRPSLDVSDRTNSKRRRTNAIKTLLLKNEKFDDEAFYMYPEVKISKHNEDVSEVDQSRISQGNLSAFIKEFKHLDGCNEKTKSTSDLTPEEVKKFTELEILEQSESSSDLAMATRKVYLDSLEDVNSKYDNIGSIKSKNSLKKSNSIFKPPIILKPKHKSLKRSHSRKSLIGEIQDFEYLLWFSNKFKNMYKKFKNIFGKFELVECASLNISSSDDSRSAYRRNSTKREVTLKVYKIDDRTTIGT